MNIHEQIKQLEIQKQELLKEQISKEKQKKIDLNRSIIGKFFKTCSSYKYRGVVGNNCIHYVRIVDFIRYNDNKMMYDESHEALVAEHFHINYSPVGWKLIPDKHNENKKQLCFTQGTNEIQFDIKKYYKDDHSTIGSVCAFSYFYPKNINKEGNIYDGDRWYKEVSCDEFYSAYNDALNYANGFFDIVNKYHNGYDKVITKESENMFENLTSGALKRIQDLIEKIDTKEINLHMLVTSLSGKVRKYNYFNGFKLDELAQYSLSGEHGLQLDIVGGDDGTDYEPYTTKYIINTINLDWKTILYPIRTKLKSVLQTEIELKKLKDIYNPYYWDCNYDTSGYDAVFNNAKLQNCQLIKVNEVIKDNLK